jgi:hypothetical protein
VAAGVGVAVEMGVAAGGGVGVGVGVAEASCAPLKFADEMRSKNGNDETAMLIARRSFEIGTIGPNLTCARRPVKCGRFRSI